MIDTAGVFSMGKTDRDRRSAAWVPPGRRHPAAEARIPMGDGRRTRASAAIISSGLVRPACGGATPTTPTSTSSTGGTGTRRSRRCSAPLSTSSRAARCARSGVRTCRMAGHEGAQHARGGLPVLVSRQAYLSLQERSTEYEIVPSRFDQGLGLVIWSPLVGGLLSGKYRRDQPAEGSRRATDWMSRRSGTRTSYRTPSMRSSRSLRSTACLRLRSHRLPARAAGTHEPYRPRQHRRTAARRPRRDNLQLSAEEHQRVERVSRPTLIRSGISGRRQRIAWVSLAGY